MLLVLERKNRSGKIVCTKAHLAQPAVRLMLKEEGCRLSSDLFYVILWQVIDDTDQITLNVGTSFVMSTEQFSILL